jgi:hypothetical protein
MPPGCSPSATSAASISAAETLLNPACAPWIARSDDREARKIASMVCTSDAAIDAYLAFGLAEAKALIEQHRTAVLGDRGRVDDPSHPEFRADR